MGKEKFMKDFNGEKIFSLEYDKETLKDMVLEKQEEIERLNNIINEAIKRSDELADEINEVEGAYSGWFLEIEEILKGGNK